MPISASPVQQVVGSWASGSTYPLTMGGSPVQGNTLIACIATNGGMTVSSITQTGVTWTKVVNQNVAGLGDIEIWSGAVGSSPGTGITVNLSGTPTDSNANVSEWSGVGVTDVSAATQTATLATVVTDTITPTSGLNELLIGCFGHGTTNAASIAGPTNGFTALTRAFHVRECESAYLVVASTTGSYSTGWTQGAGLGWFSAIASFKASVSALVPRLSLLGVG